MQNAITRANIAALGFAAAITLSAQTGLKGHWSGSIEVPQTSLGVEVDLDNTASGWVGSISIPMQGASGIPLDRITFRDGKCSFHIKGGPGDPTFSGTLSADGKTVSGDFSQGGASMSFKLSRTGEAKVATIKASTAVSAQFVGAWEGTLEVGQSLRIILKISNDQEGARAVLVSVDQGNAEIPVTSVEQKGTHLTVQANAIGGNYDAEINKEGTELNGTWSQGGGSAPLVLKKSTATKP
ncbi:MAG: hypothetical protein LAP38_23710 [Acidobacteriia bacterium]|nr:hypothetical protein [Terriglobia bacterium]